MSTTTCTIEFEVINSCYQPGELIKGCVILSINGSSILFIKALSLQFTGYAYTKWEKGQKPTKSSKEKPKIVIESREDYISTTNYLIGSELASPKPLGPGRYTYNFIVQIPQNVPTTFDSPYGAIRYELMVNGDYGSDIVTLFSTPIQIEQLKDLRFMDQTSQMPKECQQLEHTRRFKFWQQPLQLYVNLPQVAYVAGEHISVYVKLMNPNKLRLNTITTNLNRITTYRGPLNCKCPLSTTDITTIASSVHSLYGKNLTVIQHLEELYIPKTPASMTFDECKCISIAYELEVWVNCFKKNRWVRASIPILMGTISLQSNVKILPLNVPHANVASITVARSLEDLTLPPSEEYEYNYGALQSNQLTSLSMNSLASSTFQEAKFMTAVKFNKKSKHQMNGNANDFRPKYLYYNMPSEGGSYDELPTTSRAITNGNENTDPIEKN